MPPSSPAAGRPTGKDVARAAGVSQSTVSLVLAGKWHGRVSPETAVAVRDAATALGYRPNPAARSLRVGRTRTVLLVVPVLTSAFGAVHAGASRIATTRDFGIVAYPTMTGVDVPASPFASAYAAIDGVLASSMAAEALSEVRSGPPGAALPPLVLLDSMPGLGVPTVNLDVSGGMRALADHLLGLGHRRFGRLAADIPTWTFEAREAAFRAAVGPRTTVRHRACALRLESARDAARDLLTGPGRPTAVVCDDEVLAAGAYQAARDLGLRIPRDVSIAGFGDEPIARAIEPGLTTIRLPVEGLGGAGMSLLLDLLDTSRAGPDVVLPGELVVRGSTAFAPTG